MFQPIRGQEWGSEPITFQAGKGAGPDGFVRLALRRELHTHSDPERGGKHQFAAVASYDFYAKCKKKTNNNKNTLFPIPITFCRVMFSYLL